ncbi:MAG TPA: amidase [Burkholderiales bacterium]|nr:amidase [Burkholderiales bacterium]
MITERQGGLVRLGALEAAAAIRDGRITSQDLVEACLARIDEVEQDIQAWTFLDPEHALGQARAADEARSRGRPIGALHGVPVGIKDIIDTADMPTEDGTVLHAGRRPRNDATVVSLLRAAGAVILGKTVTTELAVYAPGKTRNPHDPGRTPGGSSSGSAAAVAAHMVPLAIGTQTNGSVIRPASYCGVVGYKPTHGLISRTGILRQSRMLDHVGVFARSIADAALLAQTLMSFDAADRDMQPRARPRLADAVSRLLPFPPRFAFVKTPMWGEASADTQAAFDELVQSLGDRVSEVTLPDPFSDGVDLHRLIVESDLALSFAPEYEAGAAQLSATLRQMIERGQRHLALDYNRAVARSAVYNQALDDVFHEMHAIVTPATTGEAPRGLQSTGNPVFCTLWTLCGLPAVTVPVMQGADGMPIGVQLVGPRGDDARLLQCARWLMEQLNGAE